MSKSLENNYTGEEFLEKEDLLAGALRTLEENTDNYIDTLGDYIVGEADERELDDSIYGVTNSMERLYDSISSIDNLIADENMVARVTDGDRKGFCDFEENLSEISGGMYDELESFEDLITLVHYLDEDQKIEPDVEYMRNDSTETGAPTKIFYEKDRLLGIEEDINQQYNRIAFAEILARRHTESEDPLETFEPEPPVMRMLGHLKYGDRARKLNREVRKNS